MRASKLSTGRETCGTREGGGFSLPDVDAAEHPEDQSEDESHGHGQQRAQHAVKEIFDQLERGVAPDPHLVEAVRGHGLRNDVIEADLLVV